jgi:hypothetical protein
LCFFVALRFAYGMENVDMRFGAAEFFHNVNPTNHSFLRTG